MTLDKTFDPASIESRWYAHWEANGLFRPQRPNAEPFTIVNPPPNVTGSLHIGHALDNTLQDVVIRYERLRGKDALWVVGTDHAGIATQMVVERELEKSQDKRTNYSREDFVAKVWEWKEESGGTITRQLRRLGCSMDWSREQFTMSPEFSRAVIKVFVDLYDKGLIYRDKRLVNWDPKFQTAISDLEVENNEINGHFWHFKYPLADGSGHVSVATTRPETMLADMAVAVHPSDERYAELVARGAKVRLPITGREIPIVHDEHADPELGSGAVKITPGHDFNDFEVGKRIGIKPADMLNMLTGQAAVCQTADGLVPEELLGLDRFEARKRVVAMIEAEGLLERVEDRVIQVPYGDRSNVVIEPWLTDQWYVDAEVLAQPAIKAVREGAIEIVPKSWEKTWFNWMENIQPWCVSRQLWWGHRIPAWYGPIQKKDGGTSLDINDLSGRKVFVAESFEAAKEQAFSYYGSKRPIRETLNPEEPYVDFMTRASTPAKDRTPINDTPILLYRDADVLDTWFSSALWPFATLGWPGTEKPSPLQGRGLGEGESGASNADIGGKGAPLSPALSPEGERESLLARHYPNDLLISGFDILFFWDARMAMQGIEFMGEVPWKRLYLHGLVRAADGAKMSKSKGNTVDPLGLIDRYGADALRFFMAAMESQGRDIKMDEKRVEGYRNFATKLWNAARFCEANGIGASRDIAAPEASLAVNKWIIGEVAETVALLDRAMADLRFDAAANAIYHFVWDRFCDWYLELIKPVLAPPRDGEVAGAAPAAADGGGAPLDATSGQAESPLHHPSDGSPHRSGEDETRAVAGWVLDQILVMLHPFMPFVTEELWSKLGERADYPLITAKWPEPAAAVDAEAKAEVEWVIRLVSELRGARAEINVPPSARTNVEVLSTGSAQAASRLAERFERNRLALARMGRLDEAEFLETMIRIDLRTGDRADRVSGANPERALGSQIVVDDATYLLPLEGVIDIAAEKARLAKALEAVEKEAKSLEGRLSNPNFVERAKAEAVEKARADHAERSAEAERLRAALARLG